MYLVAVRIVMVVLNTIIYWGKSNRQHERCPFTIYSLFSEKCGLLHSYADLLRTPQIKKVRMWTFAAKNRPIW